MYPRILDIDNRLVSILNKAHNIGYTKVKNGLWTCQFTLPLNDQKNSHVKPKYFVELYDHDKRIGKFIVNPKRTVKNESTKEITYTCEHVLSTLHSDVLFRYHQYSNFTTTDVLTFLLENQEVKHWVLGRVDFTRYFHYSFENEDSLLNPIMSVPKPFDVPYLWTWDDSVYPFVLNLVEPSNEVKDIIAAGKNLKGIEVDEDPTNIITRIYPLGAGEGVNQLTIESVNNGIPYLEDVETRQEYGLHKRVWPDSRFEDAETLKASAQALLDKYSKPIKSFHIDCRDYTLFERKRKRELMMEYDVGDVLLVHDQDTNIHDEIRVEKIVKGDIYGSPQDIQLELGNVFEDITSTFTDLQKKQLVNDTYSQGATNIDSRDFQDNCDPTHPARIRFPIPEDVVNINEMSLTFETQPFRAYERAIMGGGALVTATAGGGGTVSSTDSGGGSVTSSSAENYRMGTDGHNHGIPDGTSIATADGGSVTFWESGQHDHNITIPNHTHNISIPNHTHDITLPNHTHDIEYGIFEYGSMPTAVQITVDGNVLPITETSGERIDLIPYLKKTNGVIDRGRYVEIDITPNDLARINATVTSRLFIQSRIGGVY